MAVQNCCFTALRPPSPIYHLDTACLEGIASFPRKMVSFPINYRSECPDLIMAFVSHINRLGTCENQTSVSGQLQVSAMGDAYLLRASILKGSELTSLSCLPLASAPGWSCWWEERELEFCFSPTRGIHILWRVGAKYLLCICCLIQQTREIKALSRALASSLSTEEIYLHWAYLNSQWWVERSLISICSLSSFECWHFTARKADFILNSD